jgi:hypothetical protein
LRELVLMERYEGEDIGHLADEPILVYVCRIVDTEAVRTGIIREDDVHLVTWAEVARQPESLPTESSGKP